ncbi:hypothetical protein VRK_22300 [Vibrio sp. MEBiC08052]|nr:hypothetical protein VRK_22300 [Vibrio sp. MEBiC08052]
MTNNVIDTPGTVGAGDIQFFDAIQPPLKTDQYTVTASQSVTNVGDQAPVYENQKALTIDGPRFQLNPSRIHSIFPPANQTGNYANFLPNIVFNDFSLPWSRAIDPDHTTAHENTPWLGLLTLHQADFAGTQAPVSEPVTVTTAALVAPGGKILPPDLGADFVGDETKVRVVDMSLTFFQAIAPQLTELQYLSHARAVNTDGKVILNMDADGCFSLCVGNRLPGIGQTNQIMLVSFEGHEAHLNGDTITGDYDTIRLVLLGGWEFTTTNFDNEFLNMMEALCQTGNGGVSLMQMTVTGQTQDNPVAKEALETGYVALQNQMRAGEQATAWYRGPLTPSPTRRASNLSDTAGNYGPYLYSDHAIHYDPDTGIFNHAYSSAWQIGRLLALSDGTFARSIFNWRADYLRLIVDQAKQKQVSATATTLQSAMGSADAATLQSATRTFFAETFHKVDWDMMKTRKQKVLGDHVPGVMSSQEVAKVHQQGEDPLFTLNKKVR